MSSQQNPSDVQFNHMPGKSQNEHCPLKFIAILQQGHHWDPTSGTGCRQDSAMCLIFCQTHNFRSVLHLTQSKHVIIAYRQKLRSLSLASSSLGQALEERRLSPPHLGYKPQTISSVPQLPRGQVRFRKKTGSRPGSSFRQSQSDTFGLSAAPGHQGKMDPWCHWCLFMFPETKVQGHPFCLRPWTMDLWT